MIKIAGRKMNKKGYIALATLAILIIGIILSINFVNAGTTESKQDEVITESTIKIENNILNENLKEIDVVVRDGDTAWDIQSELTPNEDINEIIKQLETLNNIDLENIKSGDVIKFAMYK